MGGSTMKRRFFSLVAFLALFFAVASPAPAVSNADRESAAEPWYPGHGFFLRLAVQGLDFSSRLDDRVTPTSPEFRVDPSSTGGQLVLGHEFGPRFGMELGIGVTPLVTQPGESEAAIGTAFLLAVVPIAEAGPLRISVAAGLGLGFLYEDGANFTERGYLSQSGNMGLRVRWGLLSHARLALGFDYAIHDVGWEWMPSDDVSDSELRNIGGSLWQRSAFIGIELHQ